MLRLREIPKIFKQQQGNKYFNLMECEFAHTANILLHVQKS